MQYKKIVKEILSLKWKYLINQKMLLQLMYLSYATAVEFAESLRIAEKLYQNDKNIKALVAEELKTKNLQFSRYRKRGDHSEFLEHFLMNSGKLYVRSGVLDPTEITYGVSKRVCYACMRYFHTIRTLEPEVRAMSIFSREHELSKLFKNILENQLFEYPNLPKYLKAYQYYLKQHIHLDSQPGGHDDLVNHFPIDDRLEKFYAARLELYCSALPILDM